MKSCSLAFILLIIIITVLSSSHYFPVVSSFEFQVGGHNGWVVPPANDSKVYNDWASENRFQIGDTVHFRYKKDSVMEVSEEDYKKCNSSHPTFFSNTGNTIYKLEGARPFYFISGVSGHCHRGQRMIIKVISTAETEHQKSASPPSAVHYFGTNYYYYYQSVLIVPQLVLLYVLGSTI